MIRRLVDGPWSLLLLVILAAALRLVALGRDSLWFDEAISYLAAALPAADIVNNTVQSSHPPLYYLLLHYWLIIVPDSDAAVRLLSLFWNLALIPGIYLLTDALFERRSLALLAAALVVVSPFHVLYSHELRMYTQLMCLVIWAVWAYWRARTTGRPAWWLLFFGLSAAAIYTHLFTWLVLAAIGLFALIRHRERPALWLTILCGIGLLLLFFPWLALMLGESQKDLGSLKPLAQESARNWLQPLTGVVFLIGGMSVKSTFYTGLILYLTVAVGVVYGFEIRRARRTEQPLGRLLLPVLVVGAVVGGPALLYLVRPFFLPERTLAAASPFLLILLAWGTTRRGTPLPVLVYAFGLTMVLGTALYLTGGPVKPPYRSAMGFVAAQLEPGDAVIHTSDGSYLPALRYTSFTRHGLLAGDPDPRKPVAVYRALGGAVWTLEQAGTSGDRLWLVVALEHSEEWQLEQVNYFDRNFHRLSERNFEGLSVLLYEPDVLVRASIPAHRPPGDPGG